MKYQIKISKFEGPLDLLLKLIEKEKLDVTEISLAKIADEFLGYLKKSSDISTEELVDFLEVMVRLLLIKSRLLVPDGVEEEKEENLIDRLKIYRHYYLISKKILKIFCNPRYSFAREKIASYLLPKSFYQVKINLNDLKNSFENFLSKLPSPEEKKILKRRKIFLKEKIIELINLLSKCSEINLNTIFASKEKIEKVFIFLAVLQLLKEREAIVKQDEPFGQIILTKC